MASRRKAFVILYGASGAAALVYEITWTRALTLLMGHTVSAASTVLAAFMGGLALGSWIGGRIDGGLPMTTEHIGGIRLRRYAALELVVALWALVLPVLLAAFVPTLVWAYHDGLSPARFGIVRVLLAILALGVSTTAMGATFPIAAAWFANARRPIARRASGDGAADAGALYAANTAGAAIGALAAGFWLIPVLGVRSTTWAGILLNLASAAGALTLARAEDQAGVDPDEQRGTPRTKAKSATADLVPWPLVGCAAAATSGLVALVYEVAWTRLLTLVIGPTTYAFTIVVVSFIVGIALGSWAGARLARHSPRPLIWLGAMLLVTAVAASAGGWFAASRLPLIVGAQVANPNAAFGRIILQQASGIALLLFPMTCALGAAFPLALAAATVDRRRVGSDLARVYASNTVGAIGGALVAGFVLLPHAGLHNTFRAAGVLGIVAAAGVWTAALRVRPSSGGRLVTIAAVGLSVAVVLLLPPWDLSLLAGGAYKYAPYIQRGDLETELHAWRLLSYEDGAAATVSVRELAGMRSLVIDGKVDASNVGDMLTQRLLGLLPVLLHGHPRDVCVIGLGSGVTVQSALATGTVRHTDVVEISPEVVMASAFFDRENGGVLGRPDVRVIVGDGRSHLLLTSQRYDVIVSEPSNPWMAGIAALFTREFFEQARTCLKPNGVICQWAHTYDMRPDDLRSIVATFASVFPASTMWLVGEGDLLLIGTNGPGVDLGGIERHWREGSAPALLSEVGIDPRATPFALLSLLAGGPGEMRRYGNGAPLQRDDRTGLEFSAPRAIYGRNATDNAATIRDLADPSSIDPVARAAFQQATDLSWSAAGRMELKADAYGMAYDRFDRAVRLNSRNLEALSGLSDAAAGAHRQEEERSLLQSLADAQPDNANVRIELSRLLATDGNVEPAAAAAREAMRLAPDSPNAAEQLASVFADAGDGDRLAPIAELLVSRFPSRDKSRYYHATALFLHGYQHEAIDEARLVVRRSPHDAQAQNLLGVACASSGQRDCALAAFRSAEAANPRDPATYVNLGVFHMQAGDPVAAASYFSVALILDRSSATARQGLADAQAALEAKP